MGLLDNLGKDMVGQIAGQFGGSGQSNRLLGAAAALISRSGGLNGLMQMFQQHGMGDTVNSWISTDRNRDISPHEIQDALGQDNVRAVAQDAGVSEQEASSGLASVLPQLVDKLTPDGKLPVSTNADSTLNRLASHFLGSRERH